MRLGRDTDECVTVAGIATHCSLREDVCLSEGAIIKDLLRFVIVTSRGEIEGTSVTVDSVHKFVEWLCARLAQQLGHIYYCCSYVVVPKGSITRISPTLSPLQLRSYQHRPM